MPREHQAHSPHGASPGHAEHGGTFYAQAVGGNDSQWNEPMVQVTVCLVAKGGCTNQLVEALLPLMHRASQSAGCSGAHVCADVSDAGVLWYHEDWQDTRALEARVRSEQFSRLLALMETSARPPVLEFRTVEHSSGLEYVAAVREADRWDE